MNPCVLSPIRKPSRNFLPSSPRNRKKSQAVLWKNQCFTDDLSLFTGQLNPFINYSQCDGWTVLRQRGNQQFQRVYQQELPSMSTCNNRPVNVRIIALRQMPQKYRFSHSHDINEEFLLKFSNETITKQQFINKTSIPYLSSALQDENILSEHSTTILGDVCTNRPDNFYANSNTERESQNKIQRFKKMSQKKGDRYLSGMLMSDNKQQRYRSKTESIDKLITQSKCMPIDRLKQGTKNIHFSLKNKQDLVQDFSCFLHQKEEKQEPPPQQAEPRTILIPKRRREDKKWEYMKKQLAKNKQKRYFRQDNTSLQPESKLFSNYKHTKEEVKGFASAFKQLSKAFPVVKDFEWSKISDHPFKLKSN